MADGNTSRAALFAMAKAWEEGDPAAPCSPDPFSGEWAGDPSIEDTVDAYTALDAADLEPEELDDLVSAFEDAYRSAWQDEAERTVRGLLGD